jgi:hypothetical protein
LRTRRSGRLGGLSQEIGCLEDLVQRDFPLDYGKPLQAGLKPGPYKLKIRGHLMIDETRLAGGYLAELLSLLVSPAASLRRR